MASNVRMLDWFSMWRLKSEMRFGNSKPVRIGQVLPNYRFRNQHGELVALSDFSAPLILVLLPSHPDSGTAYFLRSLRGKFLEVRGQPTRFLVVTRPQYLSTVVALCGHLQIVADEFGYAMLDLALESTPTFYVLDANREVRSIEKDEGNDSLALAA